MHRHEFDSVQERANAFRMAPDAFAPGAVKRPAAPPKPRKEKHRPASAVAVTTATTDRLAAGDLEGHVDPPIPYMQLRIVDRLPDDDPSSEPAPREPSRREVLAARWRKLDLPARTARAAKASGAFAGRQGARVWRASRTFGRVMAMDVHGLIHKAGLRFNAWKRAKEDELLRLEQRARFSVVANRFGQLASLSAAEVAAVETVNCAERMTHQAGSDVVIEGEGRTSPRLIASGWAARIRVLPSGKRQVLALLLPGDFIDMRPLGERRPANTVTAMTVVETVDARRIIGMASEARRYPGIAEAVERAAAQEMSFADNQIVRLGAQNPVERVAHLLAELHWRLKPAGLASDVLFPMPLTCETMADMLAMKPKRVRAALRELRRRKMYSSRYCRTTLLDAGRVSVFADFRAPEAMEVVSVPTEMLMAAE